MVFYISYRLIWDKIQIRTELVIEASHNLLFSGMFHDVMLTCYLLFQ
jgi:hypothetical protein